MRASPAGPQLDSGPPLGKIILFGAALSALLALTVAGVVYITMPPLPGFLGEWAGMGRVALSFMTAIAGFAIGWVCTTLAVIVAIASDMGA